MVTPTQGFRRRVKDRVERDKLAPVSFFLETTDVDEDGNEFVVRHEDYTAEAPSEEQLIALFAEGARENATIADETAAIFDLFRAVLSEAEFRRLYRRFKDKNDPDVDFEAIRDIFEWLMEQWQDFPTTQPSDSSPSRGTTGTKSSGRAPGKGSTRSASR